MPLPRTHAFLRWIGLALIVSLAQGCATAPRTALPAPPLLDEALAPAPPIPAPAELFALSPAMRDFLERTVQPSVRVLGGNEGLLRTLYRDGRLGLQYDAERTRSAAETFADGRGNCLSLVLMTAAFARELQLPLYFRLVLVDPQWTRDTDLLFQVGHVNLGLGTRIQERGLRPSVETPTIVDFLPELSGRPSRAVEISESTIVAMFYNNRAAERLANGDAREAYWWARAAVMAEPRFSGGYNTLAVLYRRLGHPDLAERVLEQVLAREPANDVALANMVMLMRAAQRPQDLARYEARLATVQPVPPFKYFDEGLEAMKRRDYRTADELFAQELARSENNHELHFWAAMAKLALGQQEKAAQHLALAAQSSPTAGQQRIYESKLSKLQRN